MNENQFKELKATVVRLLVTTSGYNKSLFTDVSKAKNNEEDVGFLQTLKDSLQPQTSSESNLPVPESESPKKKKKKKKKKKQQISSSSVLSPECLEKYGTFEALNHCKREASAQLVKKMATDCGIDTKRGGDYGSKILQCEQLWEIQGKKSGSGIKKEFLTKKGDLTDEEKEKLKKSKKDLLNISEKLGINYVPQDGKNINVKSARKLSIVRAIILIQGKKIIKPKQDKLPKKLSDNEKGEIKALTNNERLSLLDYLKVPIKGKYKIENKKNNKKLYVKIKKYFIEHPNQDAMKTLKDFTNYKNQSSMSDSSSESDSDDQEEEQKKNLDIQLQEKGMKFGIPKEDKDKIIYLNALKENKRCNPLKEEYCKKGLVCDINNDPGICVNKDQLERYQNIQNEDTRNRPRTMKYKGHQIVGSARVIKKLQKVLKSSTKKDEQIEEKGASFIPSTSKQNIPGEEIKEIFAEQRLADDGKWYTYEEFKDYYGDQGVDYDVMWENAKKSKVTVPDYVLEEHEEHEQEYKDLLQEYKDHLEKEPKKPKKKESTKPKEKEPQRPKENTQVLNIETVLSNAVTNQSVGDMSKVQNSVMRCLGFLSSGK
jgi:hypothetical protein